MVAVHEDNDVSARSGRRRPGFEAVLAAVDAGEVEVVVAWSLDRLQRNRRDELRLYEACQRQGVILSLVNGADLDFSTAAGRFVADSLGSMARMEVDMKSDRQRRAAEQSAARGAPYGGRRPFGYEPDKVTVREDEAAAARKGYADALAGVPLAAIAREWNAAGLTTPQGKRDGKPGEWEGHSVRNFLLNPRNAGLRRFRGEIVGEAVWPALVPEETWRAVDTMLRTRSNRPPQSARRLLTALARCGACGATVHGGGSARRGKNIYRCSGSLGHVSRLSDPVDAYVEAVMVARLSRDDARELLDDHERPDVESLRNRANALRERLTGVAVEFADGDLTAGQLRAITERLREQIAAVEADLADAGRVDLLGPVVRAENVEASWNGLSVDRKRAIINLLAEVTIYGPGRGARTFRPETVTIEWRGSDGQG